MEGEEALDLSSRGVKKIEKSAIPSETNAAQIKRLNLNGNCLQRLENIDLFPELTELNASQNQLLRMYNLIKLRHLVKIDLSNNHILSIEGLSELKNLQHLNLSNNNVKLLDASHLQVNTKLEYADLSHNNIAYISNISHLSVLKVLHLHKNQIANLRHCELYLPTTLEIFTLADNNLSDLNEISHLSALTNLREFSITGNPCVNVAGAECGFDYRPFVLNWCLSLKTIDGYAVDDLENLKAEWLYSQGRGRKFQIGEQEALTKYLAEICPLTGKTLQTEQEKKLRIILSKAQQYKKQIIQNPVSNARPRKKSAATLQSLMTRSLDPTTLSSATNSTTSTNGFDSSISEVGNSTPRMSRSLIVSSNGSFNSSALGSGRDKPLHTSTTLVPAPDSLISPSMAPSLHSYQASLLWEKPAKIVEEDAELRPNKLATIRAKAVAVEKEMMKTPSSSSSSKKISQSPILSRAEISKIPRKTGSGGSGGGGVATGNRGGLKKMEKGDGKERGKTATTTVKAAEKQKQRVDPNTAATNIQKMWRGYQVRNLSKTAAESCYQIYSIRIGQYIRKLSAEMEATRTALDKEHQLQILQMEAINALWKKIESLQCNADKLPNMDHDNKSEEEGGVNLTTLAATCSHLDSRVQQLQNSMMEILRVVNATSGSGGIGSGNAIGTQTEIVAVRTPKEEGRSKFFPYFSLPKQQRPSSLPVVASSISQLANRVMDEGLKYSNGMEETGAETPVVGGSIA